MKQPVDNVKNSFRSLSDPRTIAFAAMLIALNVVLTRFFSIQTQFLRIGFGFLPVAVFSMLFGPVPGAAAAALGDLIGFFLFPGGPYFFGFTASAFITGWLYGMFLYKKDISLARICIACFTVAFLVDFCMNTVWLSLLYHQEISVIVIPRLIKTAVSLPVQVLLVFLFNRVLTKRIRTQFKL